jgi:nicotinamide mononucleotide transporter
MKNFKLQQILNKTTVLWTLSSLVLIGLTWRGLLPTNFTEVAGFLSGALCVWLVVKQNIWNWPIGILNAVAYFVLFFKAGLYADMSLQIMYVILGFLGWYWWLHGGQEKSKLNVQRITLKHSVVLAVIGVVATVAMHSYLVKIGDSAPVLDALTTVMSLVAQYMLTRKYIENWAIWIAADVIYIGLYASRGLYLTSVLYAVFLSMCIVGAITWRQTLNSNTSDTQVEGASS